MYYYIILLNEGEIFGENILTLTLFGAKVLTTLKGAVNMTGFAEMYNSKSCAGAKASFCSAANFCGYTFNSAITVGTAAAVLIFIVRIFIALIIT